MDGGFKGELWSTIRSRIDPNFVQLAALFLCVPAQLLISQVDSLWKHLQRLCESYYKCRAILANLLSGSIWAAQRRTELMRSASWLDSGLTSGAFQLREIDAGNVRENLFSGRVGWELSRGNLGASGCSTSRWGISWSVIDLSFFKLMVLLMFSWTLLDWWTLWANVRQWRFSSSGTKMATLDRFLLKISQAQYSPTNPAVTKLDLHFAESRTERCATSTCSVPGWASGQT